MKNLVGYYTVASYILIIIGGFFGFVDVFALLVSLTIPVQLIAVFMVAAVVIYSFSSFVFLTKGLKGGRQLKHSLKDLIKVNAYVSILYGFLVFTETITMLSNPAIMAEVLKQANAMQEKLKTPGVTSQAIVATFKGGMVFMMVYSALLLSHVFITLRMVKNNAGLFGAKQPQD